MPSAPASPSSRPATTAGTASSSIGRTSPSPGFTPAGRGTGESRAGDGQRIRNAARQIEARRQTARGRVSVRLAFTLPKADRVFLIVRGPAPSCRIAGYIPVRGRKGANQVAFAGRVHGRRLEPGIYLISLSPNRRLVPGAATEYVRVVSPRRSLPLADAARKPSCSEVVALAADPTARILVAEAQQSPATPAARPAPQRPAVKAVPDDKDDEEASGFMPDAGVLGVATGDGDEPFVAIAVLTLIAGLLAAMVALVTRFVRGSWNP
ncbi:MAG TPA: hypothetical protein VNP89_01050 [Gaiellaceae bacterium]|nr:hypothetical protein [Gaiellaceae bacterium]